MIDTFPVGVIDVGERHRQDLGDLIDLATSIAEIGLLHPIVVTPDKRLVAGARRLEACRILGWTEIPVTITSKLDEATRRLHAERDENTCRLDMKVSEKVALGLDLERLERPKADERRRTGNAKGGRAGSRWSRDHQLPKTADIVGKAIGLSGPTYSRAKAVVVAAESGKPEAVEALAEMDATGNVSRAYRKATGHAVHTTKPYKRGKNTNLTKIIRPVHTYVKQWDESFFTGMTPAEARRLRKLVGETTSGLFEIERALDSRATVSRALR
jgi:hypothetical protein